MSVLRGAVVGLALFLLLSAVGGMLIGRTEVWPTALAMILVIASMVLGGRKATAALPRRKRQP